MRTKRDPHTLYAYEYASAHWTEPPGILFSSPSPVCSKCGVFVIWKGPPLRSADGFAYRIVCGCGEDVIESPARLCTGGTLSWWETGGEHRSGDVARMEPPESFEDVGGDMGQKAAAGLVGDDLDVAGTETPETDESSHSDEAAPADDGTEGSGLPVYERVGIDSLVLDPDNARRHPERNIKAIVALLKEVGQQKPIVVQRSTRRILAGNGACIAAKELGWTEIDVRWSDLEGDAAERYALGDNRSGELSEWDWEVLAAKFKALDASGAGYADLGWEEFEIKPLLAAEWKPPEAKGDLEEQQGTGGIGQHGIHLTAEQRAVIDRAIAKVRSEAGEGPEMTAGRCLELVCADYLGGPGDEP